MLKTEAAHLNIVHGLIGLTLKLDEGWEESGGYGGGAVEPDRPLDKDFIARYRPFAGLVQEGGMTFEPYTRTHGEGIPGMGPGTKSCHLAVIDIQFFKRPSGKIPAMEANHTERGGVERRETFKRCECNGRNGHEITKRIPIGGDSLAAPKEIKAAIGMTSVNCAVASKPEGFGNKVFRAAINAEATGLVAQMLEYNAAG